MKTIQSELATLFTADNAHELANQLKEQIKAPYVGASISKLGGPKHVTIMLTISADPKDKWSNGILENSRYGKFSLSMDGTVENFSGHGLPKFRKRRVKDVAQLLSVLNTLVTPHAASILAFDPEAQ